MRSFQVFFVVFISILVYSHAQSESEECKQPTVTKLRQHGRRFRYKVQLNGKAEFEVQFFKKAGGFKVDKKSISTRISATHFKVTGIEVPETREVVIRWIGGGLKSVKFDGFECVNVEKISKPCPADITNSACDILNTPLTNGQSRLTTDVNLDTFWHKVEVC